MTPLLSVDVLGLTVPGKTGGRTPILDGVSFEIGEGEALGLVGESGSGKSMTAKSVTRMLPPGAVTSGSVRFDGADVFAMGRADLRKLRTDGIGIVYQDARAYINPVRTIEDFLTEGLRTHQRMSAPEARRRVLKVLGELHISDPERRLKQYPHQLSGGLLQRVLIAAVLVAEPRLIIADEPTTALDVTTQADVMAILDEQRRERGMALLFITHDLDLAAAVCDRVGVMYAGSLVETQPAAELQSAPRHPYTRALMDARPSIASAGRRLDAIRGRPVALAEAPEGCRFAPRCRFVEDQCRGAFPELVAAGAGVSRCVRAGELDLSSPIVSAEQEIR